MIPIPDFRLLFKNDLQKNIGRLSNDYTRNLYLPDIEREVIMYACDMCVEFKEKSGFLPDEVIVQIVNQVCDAVSGIVKEYNDSHRLIAQVSVRQNMSLPNIQSIIDNYRREYYYPI